MSSKVRGAELVVQALREAGIRHVFGQSGTTVLDLLDAMYDSDIEFVYAHQERVAVAMADAYARATGRLAAVLFHVGPGVVAAAAGVLDAFKEGTPMLVLTGNLQRFKLGWDAWHELDVMPFMQSITKWGKQFQSSADIPQVMREAVSQALAPRPGPVHVDMPQDLLGQVVSAPHVPQRILHDRWSGLPWPEPSAAMDVARMLTVAKKPLLVYGEGANDCHAGEAIAQLAEAFRLPIASTEIARGLVPEHHPLSLSIVGHGGHSTANRAFRESDLIIGLGCRFSNYMTINDSLIGEQRLVQVETSAEQIRGRLHTEMSVVGDIRIFVEQLHECLEKAAHLETDREWVGGLLQQWQAEMKVFFEVDLSARPVKPQRIIRDVTDSLKQDAIIVSGSGHHQHWVKKIPVHSARSFLEASTSGATGWALGGAMGAKMAYPNRQVVALIGDGDFSSVLSDLETAVRYKLAIVYVVMNDSGYGSMRASQKRAYQGRTIGNDFTNPHFGRIAELYGATGAQITDPNDFLPVFQEALQRTDRPTVIDVMIHGEEPYYRSSEFTLFHQSANVRGGAEG